MDGRPGRGGRSAARSADGGLAIPLRISVEWQRGADDPLGLAIGPRMQLVVDGRLLLSLMLAGRPVGEEGRLVGGLEKQEADVPQPRCAFWIALV